MLSRSTLTAFRCAVLAALAVVQFVPTAAAQSDPELAASKEFWQVRYRTLLERADALRATIETETELYADANRRNYRRGNKRHIHLEAAEKARAELAEVEDELSTIKDEGRRAGALPGWFYEVELDRAAIARNPALAPEPDDRDEGRNPRFVEPDDPAPASRR